MAWLTTVGDLGAGAAPVDGLQHPVEQRRELERLPVAAADQGRWGPVAGPHHRPDELEVIDAGRRVDDRGHCGAGSVLGSIVTSAVAGTSLPGRARGGHGARVPAGRRRRGRRCRVVRGRGVGVGRLDGRLVDAGRLVRGRIALCR